MIKWNTLLGPNGETTGKHRIILPGYRARDYDLELLAGVSDDSGLIPVKVDGGMDVTQVWMAAYEGTLTETAGFFVVIYIFPL